MFLYIKIYQYFRNKVGLYYIKINQVLKGKETTYIFIYRIDLF